MTVLYIAAGLPALLLLALLIPVSAVVRYDGTLRIRICYGGIRVFRYPGRERRSSRKNAPPRRKRTPAEQKKGKAPVKKRLRAWARTLRDDGDEAAALTVRELAAFAQRTVGMLLRSFTVARLDLALVVAAPDAAGTALRYGRISGIFYPSLAILEEVLRIRRRRVSLTPDFMRSQGGVRCNIKVRAIPVCVLWTVLRIYLNYPARK